ncbi:3-oxoacyl-[acyl-carrier protein] reductase [Exophiala aquamarina CBS 119918]|uniref:3-oxoacyl-[acyl-carrier-protein] reductase n=1 Tax=Exophiala aquamarina CBS 119918 TaxID=1182545 RepID=A0A072PK90_9EURO|nr:3-oxoacyl-[acyl-carrier protein] reductase [Exophiala aquamarina CBS 119918]KEF60177.1 3-oxoacyl-[acyl-carrier protein] reductase [Exophiala aquamarina CBS 119918]
MPYSLKGRRVLVTAGSRGLGALICEKFADEGAHIMVNYVSREDKAREVVARVAERGVQAFMIQGDAAKPEDNARIVKETVDRLGGLDIIVANAGWTRFSDFSDLNALPLEDWNKVN